MIVKFLCIVLTATSLHALDRDPAGYEQFLLPIYLQSARPGAIGSQWVTELSARNEGETQAQFFQRECAFFCDCPGQIGTCVPGDGAAPHTLMRTSIQGDFNPNNRGIFVYVSKNAAPAFQLRVRDLSRSTESWGTELPIVRSGEFRSTPIHLLDVPLTEGFRQHLRVYGASSPSGAGVVRVRLYATDTNDVVAERLLSLVPPNGEHEIPAEGSRPALPSYADITPLTSVLATAGPDRVRVEIAPVTPGLRFWAFVAITHNQTQHVTLVTPQ